MLLAVGGESRKIILGEFPSGLEQEKEQDFAQDVAAQYILENNPNEKNHRSKEFQSSILQPQKIYIETVRENKYKNQYKTNINMEKMFQPIQCNVSNQKVRKLIPVDFNFKLDENKEYNEYDDVNTLLENTQQTLRLDKNLKTVRYVSTIKHTNLDYKYRKNSQYCSMQWTIEELTKHEYHRFCDIQLESYDLAIQCPTRKISDRKNKVYKHLLSSSLTTNNYRTYSTFENHNNQQADIYPQTIKYNLKQTQEFNLKFSQIKFPKLRNCLEDIALNSTKIATNDKSTYPNLRDMLLKDKFSLTLGEIVHIRSVLTRAELESLPVEGHVKEDVEKRRVCFLCLKTRFGLLGPWGRHCRLCQKTVCVKCYSKMKIPTDNFANVPVSLLSPGLPNSLSSAELYFEISKSSWSKSSICSTPLSPATRRNTRKFLGSPSKLDNITTLETIGRINKNQNTVHVNEVLIVVCHDCRMMIFQIIKNSRTTRATIRNNVISRLTLDILPVYV